MKAILPLVSLCLLSTFALAADEAIPLERSEDASVRVRIGASYRGGMKLNAKGAGSRASGATGSSSKSSGSDAAGKDSESASLSFGYNGGDRQFGSGTTALGSGTIHADGTYSGGDYSAAYDDVYFSDNRTSTQTVGGRTSTKTTSSATGALAWDDDDLDGWGVVLDAELPLLDLTGSLELSVFAGFRGWWGMEGKCNGTGAGVTYRTTTTTSGAQLMTTESFYDVTAPLTLDGRLDFDNAEVFQGSTTTYTPVKGSSKTSRSSAFAVAKIEAEASLYQIPLGMSLRYEAGRWAVSLRPALLLNVVDADATRTEILANASGKVLNSWKDTGSDTAFALGAGADLAVECALDERWGLWVSGGYEWVDTVDIDVGPSKAEMDLSAWTVCAGLTRTF